MTTAATTNDAADRIAQLERKLKDLRSCAESHEKAAKIIAERTAAAEAELAALRAKATRRRGREVAEEVIRHSDVLDVGVICGLGFFDGPEFSRDTKEKRYAEMCERLGKVIDAERADATAAEREKNWRTLQARANGACSRHVSDALREAAERIRRDD